MRSACVSFLVLGLFVGACDDDDESAPDASMLPDGTAADGAAFDAPMDVALQTDSGGDAGAAVMAVASLQPTTAVLAGDAGVSNAMGTVNFKMLDEHAPTTPQTFVRASQNGNKISGFSLTDGYDGARDSQYSIYNSTLPGIDPLTRQRTTTSLVDGISVNSKSIGFEFHNQLKNGFSIDNKFRKSTNSGAFNAQFDVALGWDGTDYVAAFGDFRNDGEYDSHRGDIYGARVATDGTVLDPDGFVVANDFIPEMFAAIGSGDGSALIGASVFRLDPGYFAYRIAIRGMGDAKARESVLVDFAPIKESKIGELAAKFDIVLGVTPSDA